MDLGVLEERQRLPVPGHVKAQQQQGHAGASTGHSRFLCLPCRKAGEELKMHIFLLKYWLQCSPSGAWGEMMFHILKINTAFPEASMQPQSSQHTFASCPRFTAFNAACVPQALLVKIST